MELLKKYKCKILIIIFMIIVILFSLKNIVVAYFSYAGSAKGNIQFTITNSQLLLKSNVNGDRKEITVEHVGTFASYIRVKILAMSEESYTVEQSKNWIYKDDGYWYYTNILGNNERTEILKIETNKEVIVIAESVYAKYKDNIPYADWEKIYTNR
ncbi:MAG: hypothetical protein HFJ29_02565 [Clostridia bacterium]|nr:hypothetical protein [Clostridia bacterium]